VNNFVLIPNYFFTPNIIEKRNPLSSTARRAGWIGCNIKIRDIPDSGKIYMIKDCQVIEKEKVVAEYEKAKRLKTDDLETRGWTLDVLTCVDRLKNDNFTLAEMYNFEQLLKLKHPENNFVKDKIRQQLQVLRDKGFIEFISNGKYRRIK
jgi:type II restriction enzyme